MIVGWLEILTATSVYFSFIFKFLQVDMEAKQPAMYLIPLWIIIACYFFFTVILAHSC